MWCDSPPLEITLKPGLRRHRYLKEIVQNLGVIT
ncbi:MAG: hypothetical protein QOD93_2757, partial [Acetobacteraceae bacterium]|nr:hypothetical protein [Acetobacteraceae bacterium]